MLDWIGMKLSSIALQFLYEFFKNKCLCFHLVGGFDHIFLHTYVVYIAYISITKLLIPQMNYVLSCLDVILRFISAISLFFIFHRRVELVTIITRKRVLTCATALAAS